MNHPTLSGWVISKTSGHNHFTKNTPRAKRSAVKRCETVNCPRFTRNGFKHCPQHLHLLGLMDRVRKIEEVRAARAAAGRTKQ